MTTTTLPNLAGVIKTTDIYKKMKFDYVAWAKTAQILREHAPGWQFCLDKSSIEDRIIFAARLPAELLSVDDEEEEGATSEGEEEE